MPNPLPPSSLFITEPWVEGEGQPSVSLNPNSQRGGFERGLPIFSTVVKNASGLFETNPEFLKTVHSGGVGREKEEEAVRRAEKEEWEKRVVVEDKVLRVTLPRGPDRPAQVDKFKSILHGQPKKKSIKDTHVPPPPFSIFKASEQHNKQRTVEAAKDRSKFDPTLSVGESDFDRYKVVLPPKSFVARQAKPNSDDL